MKNKNLIFLPLIVISLSCKRDNSFKKEEAVVVDSNDTIEVVSATDSTNNNVLQVSASFSQLNTKPSQIIITGAKEHKLLPIYKFKKINANTTAYRGSYSYNSYDDGSFFIPGLDLSYGYNMVNLAHYNTLSNQLNYFFKKPALIKTIYYPSAEQDSIDKTPAIRNYYLVSVNDEDTNKDTLLTKKDLRRLYYFDLEAVNKTLIIPSDYSVKHSQYDSKSDIMYIYARKDENKNGMIEKSENTHIFWIDMKNPLRNGMVY